MKMFQGGDDASTNQIREKKSNVKAEYDNQHGVIKLRKDDKSTNEVCLIIVINNTNYFKQ